MKIAPFKSDHLLIPAIILSSAIHGSLIAASGWMPSLPQYSVVKSPNSFEVTVISQPLDAHTEDDVITGHITNEPVEDFVFVRPPVEGAQKPASAPVNDIKKSQGALARARPLTQENPAPVYPRVARQRGWEGTVLLVVLVDRDGIPDQVDIQESSGYGTLDQAALNTVKQWKFSPARSGPIRYSSKITIPIQFTLIRE